MVMSRKEEDGSEIKFQSLVIRAWTIPSEASKRSPKQSKKKRTMVGMVRIKSAESLSLIRAG